MINNDTNYDTLVTNPSNPVDLNITIFKESLFSNMSSCIFYTHTFNISTFNINNLRVNGPTKISGLSTLFSLKHIIFGDVVDTYLSSKQMKFLSKPMNDYSVFSFTLDQTRHICSTDSILLFIHNSIISHV